jgi:myo-inositol 2-dehydrogenase/D-chiro-inositol 1-dehydrogenase/scyllo-inositol 2-dehydrogenase (NAD+)
VADPADTSREAARRDLGLDGRSSHADFRAALSDARVDAVVVATPTALHEEMCVAAAEAGKHILCEKPLAMNAEECAHIIHATAKAGVKLQVGFMRRYDPSFVAAKERIDAGDVGDVVLVRSLTHGPSTPKPWMYDLRKSNGPLAEVNSHDIDTLRWFTGSEFAEVYAIAGNFRSPEARRDYPDFYDNVVLVASFGNGMQGCIGGAQGVRYGYDSRCEILGTRGIVLVGRQEAHSVVSCTVSGATWPFVRSWQDLFTEAYAAEDADFIQCILEDREPRVTGKDGLEAVRVVNAGNRSIGERRPVRLESDGTGANAYLE